MALFLFVVIALLLSSSNTRKIYDLTRLVDDFNQSRIHHEPPFNNLYKQSFCAFEDSGTHLNAPYKTNKYEWTADNIPVRNLLAPLMIIRLGHDVRRLDIENWERRYRRIPRGSVFVLDSGWSRHWMLQRAKYRTISNADRSLAFPGFHISACEYLVNRKVVGVGVDTFAVDGRHGEKYGHPCQELLNDNQCYVLENLNNLSELPVRNATIFVGALKIKGGTGSPARIFAYMDNSSQKNSSRWIIIVVIALPILRGLMVFE